MVSMGIRVMLKVLEGTNSKSGDLRLAAIEGDVEEATQSNETH